MKKIVMGMAALAMAASIFAADVSAKVDINGNLFGLKADKTLAAGETTTVTTGSALTLALDSQPWNANMGLSFSDDKSGAAFKASTKGSFNSALIGTGYKVWFNAFGLKFQFGDTDIALNKEQIDWSKFKNGIDGNWYSVNYSNNGFALDVALQDGWMKISDYTTDNDGDPVTGVSKVGGTYVKATYGADFGTVGAFMHANFMNNRTFGNIKFGAGYSNNFNGIDMSATVWANVKDGYALEEEDYFGEKIKQYKDDSSKQIEKVQLELFAKGSVDALSWAAYAIPYIDLNVMKDYSIDKSIKKVADKNDIDYDMSWKPLDFVGYLVKGTVDYALDACTLCCKVTLEDATYSVDGDGNPQGQFGTIIEPGVKGKVGACDWEVFGKLTLQNVEGTDKKGKRANAMSVAFEVPVSFAVAF